MKNILPFALFESSSLSEKDISGLSEFARMDWLAPLWSSNPIPQSEVKYLMVDSIICDYYKKSGGISLGIPKIYVIYTHSGKVTDGKFTIIYPKEIIKTPLKTHEDWEYLLLRLHAYLIGQALFKYFRDSPVIIFERALGGDLIKDEAVIRKILLEADPRLLPRVIKLVSLVFHPDSIISAIQNDTNLILLTYSILPREAQEKIKISTEISDQEVQNLSDMKDLGFI